MWYKSFSKQEGKYTILIVKVHILIKFQYQRMAAILILRRLRVSLQLPGTDALRASLSVDCDVNAHYICNKTAIKLKQIQYQFCYVIHKIYPISHHTLTSYTGILCILRAVTLSNGEI